MSQVFIEFTEVAPSSSGQDTPVSSSIAVVEEITSSGTTQATTATASGLDKTIITVINNGTETIWVNFGDSATAASPSRPIAPNTQRDFGEVPSGATVSVINDI